jgi:hypothetical protein
MLSLGYALLGRESKINPTRVMGGGHYGFGHRHAETTSLYGKCLRIHRDIFVGNLLLNQVPSTECLSRQSFP